MATTRSRLGRAHPMAIALILLAVTLVATSAQAGTTKIRRLGNPVTAFSAQPATTMADLRTALTDIEGADRVDVAFVTVDPGRDSPDETVAYAQAFFPTGIGLRTADPALLEAAASAFEASYAVDTEPDGTLLVSHTAFLYAIDTAGTIIVQWPFGFDPAHIRADLEVLLARA